jgi:hypothetical protein
MTEREPTDGEDGEDGNGSDDSGDDDQPLPAAVRREAKRLTRHARRTGDEDAAAAYRRERDALVAEYDYTARVRDEDDTLVLYPDRWLDGDTVRPERIEDTDAAAELALGGGDEDWDAVEAHNRAVVAAVEDEHGAVHGANATALADFAGNHLGKRIEALTDTHIEQFLTDYFPRNAWPDETERAAVEESVALTVELAAAKRD